MSNVSLTREEFVDFVRTAQLGVVSTVDRDNRPEAAIMEIAALGDGELLFVAKTEARKVANLFHNPRAAIVVGWSPVSLQIEGEAELLMGIEREALGALYAEQFPERPALTEAFALYRVRPDWLRYCEARPGLPPLISEGLWL